MNSLILKTITRFLIVWMLLFSLWLLIRGHHEVGGGFIAGLVAASALSLYLLAFGWHYLLSLIRLAPKQWLCIGFACMIFPGFWSVVMQTAFYKTFYLPGIMHWLNSPFIFDLGIYIVVCFAVLLMMVMLEKTL